MSKERGCGSRKKGGIYAACGSEDGTLPIGLCFLCPPRKLSPAELGLSPIGVKLIKNDMGVYDVWDWVGAKHYPNASDFVEETLRMGLSRRLSSRLEFEKLTPTSQLVIVHPFAGLPDGGVEPCDPKVRACPVPNCHTVPEDCLSRLWEQVDPETVEGGYREGFASARYPAQGRDPKTKLTPAILGIFPLERIEVVKDDKDPKHERESYESAMRANVPVVMVED